jgi:hypothetical protein
MNGSLRAWAVACALGAAVPVSAQEHRGQLWVQAVAQGKLGPMARAFFEVQPRLGLTNRPRADVVLMRAALGAEVLPGLSLWLGVGWIPAWTDDSIESVSVGEGRLYQQVQYARSSGALGLLARLRFEQRLIDNAGGVSLRPRLLVRGTWRFLEAPALHLALQDEVFVTLNQRPGGPPAGFDQNRSFLALGWWPVPAYLLELGYQLQVLRRAAPAPLRLGHTVLLSSVYNF